MDIFQCAEKYGVAQLADQCKREIQDCLQRPFNYIEVFRYSKQIHLEYVYNTTLSIIATKFEEVVKNKNFMSLTAEELTIFLQKADSILIDELTLFKTLNKWATAQCQLKDKNTSGEEKRQELGPLLFQVRIPSIPLQTFSDEIVSTGILTNHEQLSLFKYYSGVEKSATSVCGFCLKPRRKKAEEAQYWKSPKKRSNKANR
ncbi:BTB/POZ domain-containing protein 3-like [Mytilus edulis]|uniref:BTB/POZ domain-containing protein 3-like n=1 Tax=Mytilus edulis TaxID=6550 RepID=UPI0039EE89D0